MDPLSLAFPNFAYLESPVSLKDLTAPLEHIVEQPAFQTALQYLPTLSSVATIFCPGIGLLGMGLIRRCDLRICKLKAIVKLKSVW